MTHFYLMLIINIFAHKNKFKSIIEFFKLKICKEILNTLYHKLKKILSR